MNYKVLIMAGLLFGGFSFLSCNQQGKSQQTEEQTNSEAAVEVEEVIVSKDKDWSERVIVVNSTPGYVGEHIDTLTLYRDGTATDNISGINNYSFRGYWEQGSFVRGDTEYPAIKVTFSTDYTSNVFFMEANAHEGDFVYKKYEDMLRKTHGYEIILEEVYR